MQIPSRNHLPAGGTRPELNKGVAGADGGAPPAFMAFGNFADGGRPPGRWTSRGRSITGKPGTGNLPNKVLIRWPDYSKAGNYFHPAPAHYICQYFLQYL